MRPNDPRPITYKEDENGCWICTSHVEGYQGYPLLKRNKKRYTAHRWVYMQEHDISHLSYDIKIRHTCDTPMCVNPNHLLAGSAQDNMNDKVKRNRQRNSCGIDNPYSKLTNKQVLEIRCDNTKTQRELGKLYNVSQSLISLIKLKKHWKHLT